MGNLSSYLAQARQQAAGAYNSKKAQLQSAYNDQLAGYGNDINDINTNYKGSVDTANRNNQNNLNSYNNNVLSRGLARSSIASTGLAGINNATARVLGELESTKNSQLDRVNQLKETLRSNFNSSLSAAQSEYESNAMNLAQQMYQQDQQLAAQRAAAQAEAAYRQQQMAEQIREFNLNNALERDKFNYSKQSPTNKNNAAQAYGYAQEYLNKWAGGDAYDDSGSRKPRATADEINSWVGDNAGTLASQGVDVNKLSDYASNRFTWNPAEDSYWNENNRSWETKQQEQQPGVWSKFWNWVKS